LAVIGTPEARAVAAQALGESIASQDRASLVKMLLDDPGTRGLLEKIADASGLKPEELIGRDLQGRPVAGGAPPMIVRPSYEAWNWFTGVHFAASGDTAQYMLDGHVYDVGRVDGYGCTFGPGMAPAEREGSVTLVTKYAFAELWADLPDGGLYAVTVHLAPNLVGETLATWLARTPCPVSLVVNGERQTLVANPGRSALTALYTAPIPLPSARLRGFNMRRVNCNMWLRLEAPPGATSPSNALFGGFTVTRL
jgi:hypothetical protein